MGQAFPGAPNLAMTDCVYLETTQAGVLIQFDTDRRKFRIAMSSTRARQA
jgi:hypothetical protein